MTTRGSGKFSLSFATGAATIGLLLLLPFAAAEGRWLEKTTPSFPYGVYYNGWQGSVVVSLVMDRDGRVVNTQVLRSSGFAALDALARQAALGWRLSPDSVVPSDITQGRVEMIRFQQEKNQVSRILPNARPYWVRLSG